MPSIYTEIQYIYLTNFLINYIILQFTEKELSSTLSIRPIFSIINYNATNVK